MNTIAVKNGKRVIHGKSAILTPATNQDRHRAGADWQTWEHWTPGGAVQEVEHFGRHTTRLGDTFMVRDVPSGELVCPVEVVQIRMTDTGSLTADELADLGYASREAFDQENPMRDRRVWLMHVFPIATDGNNLH
jgi:hypothetical protein